MAKKYDLAVKTGSYTGNDGQEKGRYENCGEVHPGKDGGHYAIINPFRMLGLCQAALAKGQDRMMVSMFAPRDEQQGQQRQSTRQQSAPAGDGFDDFDSVPF